jgi:hypothetical protein
VYRFVVMVFKVATVAVTTLVAVAAAWLRFGGDVRIPPKPPPPSANTSVDLDQIARSEQSWRTFLERDAVSAGIATPTPEAMGRKLRFRLSEQAVVVAPGEAPIEMAGLRLTARIEDDIGSRRLLVLRIKNLTARSLAYHVVTAPRPDGAGCNQRSILAHNALVLEPSAELVRSECSYRPGMSLAIERVETLELDPLMALYVSRLPPRAVGIEPRLALGHAPVLPNTWSMCGSMAAQSVRAAMERGQITWRDLVDFYARHRCGTYNFVEGYRAFETDSERRLPSVD